MKYLGIWLGLAWDMWHVWPTCTLTQQSQMELQITSNTALWAIATSLWDSKPIYHLWTNDLRFLPALTFFCILNNNYSEEWPNSCGLFTVTLSSEKTSISLPVWGDKRKTCGEFGKRDWPQLRYIPLWLLGAFFWGWK